MNAIYQILMGIIGTVPSNILSSEQVDGLVNMAIDRAVKAIVHYTGWTAIEVGYESVVASLALSYLMADTQTARLFMDKPFISQQSQGSRSATYKTSVATFDESGLTAEVKAALPLPRLKVL